MAFSARIFFFLSRRVVATATNVTPKKQKTLVRAFLAHPVRHDFLWLWPINGELSHGIGTTKNATTVVEQLIGIFH